MADYRCPTCGAVVILPDDPDDAPQCAHPGGNRRDPAVMDPLTR